jgi:hypothetical protein
VLGEAGATVTVKVTDCCATAGLSGKTKVSGPFVWIVAYETKGPDTFVFSILRS